jgi:hypothetical protein
MVAQRWIFDDDAENISDAKIIFDHKNDFLTKIMIL